ncbi:MAG: putative endonuclease [Bacteroidota bacterium]|nr:putative endonuclease [Rikenellaceae bacterium]MDK2969702.1 putative endonuclease [Bacteroidota bacterium]MDN5355395.1 putative endonuclease [Rikenellaceae bacterium]
MKGYMYILECADGSYYTGSTRNLERRLQQHQNGEGSNHTKKHLPVKLVYFEEFQRIDEAFYREKQVQGWSRKKKEALINGCFDKLISLSKNYTQYPRNESVISTSSITDSITDSITEENEAVSEPVEDTAKTEQP